VFKKLGLAVLLATLSGVACAGETCSIDSIFWFPVRVCHSTGGSGSSPTATPEIDPASAVAGLTLVVGGLIVLRGRRRSKDSNA
jgi:hypothetical protein